MKKDRKKLIKKVKNERGAITAMVLASLLVIAIVLINLYMMGSNKSNSQDKEIKMIEEAYNSGEDKTDLEYKESIVFENINTADTNPKEALPSNIKEIVENDANKGIVIKDNNDNEWVWVEVPKTTVFSELNIDTTSTLTAQNYADIANKMITYAGVYRNGSANQNCTWTDEWYDGCGLTQQEYINAYQSMLKYVYNYGGFWIGRYEAGIDGSITDLSNARTSSSSRIVIGTSPKAISQKDAIPYNYITCSEAQKLANEMTPDSNYRTSLLFGIQWDLTCKFLEVKSDLNVEDINSASGVWGNYANKARRITSDGAKQTKATNIAWKTIMTSKPALTLLLSTGASDENKMINIYDFAGNEWECTLEKSDSHGEYFTIRGGGYFNPDNDNPASYRHNVDSIKNDSDISFRPTLYKK